MNTIRIQCISKLLSHQVAGQCKLWRPFVMMARHRNQNRVFVEGAPSEALVQHKIVPMWLEFVEHDKHRREPEQLRDYLLNAARVPRHVPKEQSLTNWMSLPFHVLYSCNHIHQAKMLSLNTLLGDAMLNQGDEGDVVFYHAPMFGLGSVCAFWADSEGAAKRFLE